MALKVNVVSPPDQAPHVALREPVVVTFSAPIDRDSVNRGSFVVATAAKNVVTADPIWHLRVGSDLLAQQDLLESPGFTGLLEGSFSFSQDLLTVTFTPLLSYAEDTIHTILLSTDILTRTIGDLSPGSVNQGNGFPELTGPYTGNDDSILITIVKSGPIGTAQFQYAFGSDPGVWSDKITTDNLAILLERGLKIHFAAGDYIVGDSWIADLYKGIPLDHLYSWAFTTSFGSIITPPEEIRASSLEGSLLDGTSTSSDVTSVPAHKAIGVALSTSAIVLTFPESVDSTSLAGLTVTTQTIQSAHVNSTPTALAFTISVSGAKVTITLAAALLKNQEVSIRIEGVKAVDGTIFQTQVIWFTTILDPAYTNVETVQLEIGPFISNIPDDTVNRLIYRFSVWANYINWSHTPIAGMYAYLLGDFVLCKVIQALLQLGAGGRTLGRTLGDFSFKKGVSAVADKLKQATQCANTLEDAVKRGGFPAHGADVFIKSYTDPERVRLGRMWNPQSGTELPIANTRVASPVGDRIRREGTSEGGYLTGDQEPDSTDDE